MKLLAVTLVAAALSTFSTAAFADPPAPTRVHVNVDVTARVEKPRVEIVVARPSAVSVAGAAHDTLRQDWLKKAEPPAMRAPAAPPAK